MKKTLTAIAAIAVLTAGAAEANLFGKWKPGTVWVHHPDAKIAALRTKVAPLVTFTQEETKEGTLLKTVKDKKIEEITGETTVSGSWEQTVKLSDTKGGTYQLAMDYRSIQTGKNPIRGFIVIITKTAGKAATAVKTFPVGSGKWEKYSVDLNLPAETGEITIYLRLDGCGKIEFKAPSLKRK